MSIAANKASQTAQRLSKILDVPTGQIEAFLDTFRTVPKLRKNPPMPPETELYQFYRVWLPVLISELSSEVKNEVIFDCYIAFDNLGSNDFFSLLLTLDPKDFNGLIRSIVAIARK
jgi:hypothetical protein